MWVPDVPGRFCPVTLSLGCFFSVLIIMLTLFSGRFWEGISFPNFVEVHPELPISKLCAVPFALQDRALFQWEKRERWRREKGRKRGVQQTGQEEKRHVKTGQNMWVFVKRGFCALPKIDDRQITHLICVRLKHLLYDLFRGCFGPFTKENNRRRKTPPKKSYSKCFRLTQIR